MGSIFDSVGQVFFFNAIRDYLDNEIMVFQSDVVARLLLVTGAIAMTLMTIWIMVKGFMILTGRMKDSLMAFVVDAGKAMLIVMIATGFAAAGTGLFSKLNQDLSDSVSGLLTGSTAASSCTSAGGSGSVLGCTIDRNLAVMQVTLGAIKSIDTGGDQIVEDEKNRALWMSGIGVAGPSIIAGVMLLLNKFAMALFVAFGPIFILCLLSNQTKPLFSKWLYFGIATTFTTVMLAVVTSMAMKMVGALAAATMAADFLGASSTGFTEAAMQQGGLGLILSTLLITVPPMAGNFFGGVVSSFNPNSAFGSMAGNGRMSSGGGGGGYGGGSYGGAPTSIPTNTNAPANTHTMDHSSRVTGSVTTAQSDVIKTNPMMGNAQSVSNSGSSIANTTGSYHNASAGSESTPASQRLSTLMSTPKNAEV